MFQFCTGRQRLNFGNTLKTNWENVGGANRRELTTDLPASLALESILAERKDTEPDQVWAKQDD